MSDTPEDPRRRHSVPGGEGVVKATSCRAPLVFLLGLLLVSASAQAIEVGERLAPWTLEDQFGDTVTLDEQTSLLLVASSRKAADVMDAAIKNRPKGYLEARNALYVTDISRIPGLVAKFVQVPSMRSANYRALLDRESRVASNV